MPLCLYGSAPKAGAPPYVWLTWLDAQPWLGVIASKLSFLFYLVPPVLKEINSFCATEPPQPLAPTNADIEAAAQDGRKFEALIQYIKDSIYWWVWSNQCVCSPNPASSCAQRYPDSESTTVQSALGAGYELAARFTVLQSGLSFYGWRIWHSQDINTTVGFHLWDYSTGTSVASQNETGNTAGYHEHLLPSPFSLVNGRQYAAGYGLPAGYQYYADGPNTPPTNAFVSYDGSRVATPAGTLPTTVGGLDVIIDPVVCTTSGGSGSPTAPAAPSVPTITTPDFPGEASCTIQDVCNLVQQVLQSVTLVRSMVDLIQRQEVPFAYITGAVHSGLTGSGSFAVQDILGLLVQVSIVPPRWGLSSDNPLRYIPAPAMVAVGTAHGDQDTHFVHFTEELYFPEVMGAMTKVTYEFKPGCGGVITELVREP